MPKEYRAFPGAVLTAAKAGCTVAGFIATGKSLTSVKTYHLLHALREESS